MWRLSSIGRKHLGITKPPIYLHSPKVEHILGVASIYIDLMLSGRLAYFKYEPQDKFYCGKELVYAPDAFFILKEPYASYVLEYQRSPLSSNRWAAKWAIASAFMDGGYYEKASWQVKKGFVIKPKIVVVSGQQVETVRAESSLPLVVVKDFKDILN